MAKGSISHQIDDILTTYTREVHHVLDQCVEEEARDTAKRLKASSPKRRKYSRGYARSWGVVKRGDTYIVRNAKHYRLTHLLENGHVIKNGVGKYGRVKPRKHIGPAEDAAAMRLPLRIKARLRML